MKIAPFHWKNDDPQNWLLIFFRKKTHSEKNMEIVTEFIEKGCNNNNSKPWKSSKIFTHEAINLINLLEISHFLTCFSFSFPYFHSYLFFPSDFFHISMFLVFSFFVFPMFSFVFPFFSFFSSSSFVIFSFFSFFHLLLIFFSFSCSFVTVFPSLFSNFFLFHFLFSVVRADAKTGKTYSNSSH